MGHGAWGKRYRVQVARFKVTFTCALLTMVANSLEARFGELTRLSSGSVQGTGYKVQGARYRMQGLIYWVLYAEAL
jgi:hypothetical protein